MSALKCVSRLVNRFPSTAFRTYSKDAKIESPLKGLLDNAASFNDRYNKEWSTQPYPVIQGQEEDEISDEIDPRETSIILFPGQGSQFNQMGAHMCKYPNTQDLYSCANEIAGVDLRNLPKKEDNDKYSQISIVVASLAAVQHLQDIRPSVLPSCTATGGFSLGELTALIFSGAIKLEDGLKLVNVRALAMEAASKENPGGMMTVFCSPETNIKSVCYEAEEYCIKKNIKNPICKIANYLFPQCVVLSGHLEALKFITNRASDYAIKKTKPLNVSGAFHTEYMESAVQPLAEALQACYVNEPAVATYTAVNCKQYSKPGFIKSILPMQIVKPVRWEQLMHKFYKRPKDSYFPKTYEVGPGRVLRGILRKINGPAWDNSYSIPE